MGSKHNRAKRSGTFTLAPGTELYGELTIAGPKSSLYLHNKDSFATNNIPDRCITGVLRDFTEVPRPLDGCGRGHKLPQLLCPRWRFDYDRNFEAVTFFTNTLEFVFATSDLIDAGWDARSWISHGTTMTHPFGQYRANYPFALKCLKTLLAAPTTVAKEQP